MSLLLEALKKAEKAKEEAQKRARDDGESARPAHVLTRDQLPEIGPHALDLGSEDLSSPSAPPPPPPQPVALELEPETAPARAAPKPAPPPAPAKSPAQESVGRASAKKVFEAKFREPNPRLPFYVTLGVLGAFAVGTVGYFWYQLRPPPPLVNRNPTPATQTAAAPAAESRSPGVAAARPAALPQSAIPGLPSLAPKAAAPLAPAVAPNAVPAAAPVVDTPRLTPRLQPQRAAPATPPEMHANPRTPPQVHPRVEAGYSAYMAGDLAAARGEYQQALREEPSNRDALLGLAALDVRASRYEAAEALYMRVLQADPRDAQAQAALIALRSGRADPLATESRVKSMLAADPGAHALNFTLGNQLAQQNRWAEAQQEYFKAYTAEPDNPDFAYNLAVSLDHLRQNRQALDYYQRAVALGEKRGASFDLGAAKNRAAELAK